jgi:16S rRNA processing protein RimM
MVPFVRAIVPTVDVSAGTVTVTPPVGLFEEIPDDDDDERAPDADAADADDAGSGEQPSDAEDPADAPTAAPTDTDATAADD